MKVWKGNVTLEASKLQTLPNYQSKVLSATQTQQIRGAFWGSILGLIGSILVWIPLLNPLGLALTAISAIVSGIEGDWISAISSIVTLGIAPNGLGGFFKDVFHGVTNALGSLGQVFNAVGGFVSNVYGAVVGFAGNISSGIGGFLHGALGVSSKIAANIASTAVSIGVNYGVSKGFEVLGVNPQLASFFGSLAAGAVIGGFKSLDATKGITQAVNIQQSVSSVITLTNVGRLGLELGLDNSFTNIIGLSLAAMQGSFIDKTASTLSAAFANIKPQLASSLSLYGLDKLGSSLGLPGGIASVAAAPILGVLQNGSAAGSNIIASIQEGLTNAAIGYGIHFATGSISNPLLGSLASRALAGAIEGALFTGNIFTGLFDAAKKSVLDLFGGNKQELLANVTDLSVLISQKGSLSAALEAYAVQIFDRGTIESVVRSGGFTSALLSPKQNILLPTGVMGKESILSNGTSILFDAQGSFIGFKRQGVIELGQFGITDTGKFGLKNGQVYGMIQSGNTYSGSVKDGQAITLTIDVGDNEIKIGGTNNSSVVFDQAGQMIDGYIDVGRGAYNFVVNAGNLQDYFVSTAQAADFTIVMPGGQVYHPTQLDIKPDQLAGTGTDTQTGPTPPKYLVRFMTQAEFLRVATENKLFTNQTGDLYTTDNLSLLGDTPKGAADSLQLGNGLPYVGHTDESRAGYFVVFDTRNLSLTMPQGEQIKREYATYDGKIPDPNFAEYTGREQRVFRGFTADSPIINLLEPVQNTIRKIHLGMNNIFERFVALFEIAQRAKSV